MARIIRCFAHLGFWISDERVETDLVFEEFEWNDTSRLQKMQNTVHKCDEVKCRKGKQVLRDKQNASCQINGKMHDLRLATFQ